MMAPSACDWVAGGIPAPELRSAVISVAEIGCGAEEAGAEEAGAAFGCAAAGAGEEPAQPISKVPTSTRVLAIIISKLERRVERFSKSRKFVRNRKSATLHVRPWVFGGLCKNKISNRHFRFRRDFRFRKQGMTT